MRRADRLFQIIQILRRSTRPVTAGAMASELEVSKRTIYRDIADLIGQRVPIAGEAGFGYLLAEDYDMPPLMLTPDEIEAVVLGAQWVAGHADAALANAARDLTAKIAATIPQHLRPYIAAPSVGAKPGTTVEAEGIDPVALRNAIRGGQSLALTYRAETGEISRRIVRPVVLGYAETTRLLVAWCELRQDFRHFRTDRIVDMDVVPSTGRVNRETLFRQWQAWRARQMQADPRGRAAREPDTGSA